jgi:hypothetical protein
MLEPSSATFTAGAIASMAFQKFLEAGFGELAKQLTKSGIDSIDRLRTVIIQKLRGSSKEVNDALNRLEQGDSSGLDQVSQALDTAMMENQAFASTIRALAQEISLEIQNIEDRSTLNQFNYGGNNFQAKTGSNNTNFFGGTHTYNSR